MCRSRQQRDPRTTRLSSGLNLGPPLVPDMNSHSGRLCSSAAIFCETHSNLTAETKTNMPNRPFALRTSFHVAACLLLAQLGVSGCGSDDDKKPAKPSTSTDASTQDAKMNDEP